LQAQQVAADGVMIDWHGTRKETELAGIEKPISRSREWKEAGIHPMATGSNPGGLTTLLQCGYVKDHFSRKMVVRPRIA
uniref:hypothetical protein n=1 Tax=Cephaloticoccus sp. TaxID=1985742 RepID=UPI0040494D30